ncbi:MAG: hypothetical protein KJN71_03960 [Acidimicrobiia bacterium]|nr:hypothetical protein [Acidimicrobiia bacterium]NNC74107.1 hypothetical protein [Acidimicrobiia bacterium]
MQYIMRYALKDGVASDFRDWVQKNGQEMGDHAADGWSYLGTYFTVMGFGTFEVETRWEVENYSTFEAGFGDDTFQRLFGEWNDFINPNLPGETYLMKSAGDVAIME